MHKLVIFFSLLIAPGLSQADNLSDSNRLFDCVEQYYPELFSPAGVATFPLQQYIVRYYTDTDTYIGTEGNDVYVYGNVFGGLLYVGQLNEILEGLCPEIIDQDNGIDFRVRPAEQGGVVEVTWKTSNSSLNAGNIEFTIQLYVGGGQKWFNQVSTSETSDRGSPVFLGGVPANYCFRMIATEDNSIGGSILGSGTSGNRSPCI